MSSADFEALVERATRVGSRAHMRPVVEKELLHYDILFALDKDGLLDLLTFQGGTSLRLCYGAQRFSEDLDFVGGRDFAPSHLIGIKSCLERYIGARYGLEVSVREPRQLTGESGKGQVEVHKWQIRVVTAPALRDLPRQMIRIEIANVPAYTREPQALQRNYDFLPDGYADLVILTESLDEIMADKLVSLVACTAYVRFRDVWDLQWLRQQGATMNAEWVQKKIEDYNVRRYREMAASLIERLPAIVHGKEFKDQMSRFIPMEVQERTLLKEKFRALLIDETSKVLQQAASRA